MHLKKKNFFLLSAAQIWKQDNSVITLGNKTTLHGNKNKACDAYMVAKRVNITKLSLFSEKWLMAVWLFLMFRTQEKYTDDDKYNDDAGDPKTVALSAIVLLSLRNKYF